MGQEARIARTLIRPATIADVYAVARRLRVEDAAEATALGKDPRRALRIAFRASLLPPKLFVVDGEPAAIFGLAGDILSDVGEPWLLTTAAVERAPVSFVRGARLELAVMLEHKPRLENYVVADYAKAIRLLEVLGFNIDPPAPIGPKRALFRRFWIEV